MSKVTTSQRVERLKEFIGRFQPQLGRRDRLSACQAYLTDLLIRHDSAKESVASSVSAPHTVRQFVNRSPWDDEAIMSRLRARLFSHRQDPTGALVLTEVNILKKGRCSVGVNVQRAKDRKAVPFTSDANCQCVVMWCWVTKKCAWPVAARLYLPQKWTLGLPRTMRVGIPDQFLDYQEKTKIALNLLDTIKPQMKAPCALVIDRVFQGELDLLLDELERRSHHYLAASNHPKLFPEKTAQYRLKTPHKKWLTEIAFLWALRDLERKLKSSVKIHAADENYMIIRPSRQTPKQFIFCHRERKNHIHLYITNRVEENSGAYCLAMVQSLKIARRMCSDLLNTGGLRRFEGRTWRGFHHHLTLCFMAHYFSMQKTEREVSAR